MRLLLIILLLSIASTVSAQTFPSQPVNFSYQYEETSPGVWEKKSQAEIDDLDADLAAAIEADRLIREYSDSDAAKSAKSKEVGLDQKTIDKLTEKEK